MVGNPVRQVALLEDEPKTRRFAAGAASAASTTARLPSSRRTVSACVPGKLSPNPSIERTSSSKLRLLPAAAHVER